jgi:hypothetical protein
MARIIHTGIPAEPTQPISAAVCRTAIDKLQATLDSRPHYQPTRPTALVLDHPACEHMCRNCYMSCAIAPERIDWWQKELAIAEAYESGLALEHGGALFLEPAGRA